MLLNIHFLFLNNHHVRMKLQFIKLQAVGIIIIRIFTNILKLFFCVKICLPTKFPALLFSILKFHIL